MEAFPYCVGQVRHKASISSYGVYFLSNFLLRAIPIVASVLGIIIVVFAALFSFVVPVS